jgi:hypothetical protein
VVGDHTPPPERSFFVLDWQSVARAWRRTRSRCVPAVLAAATLIATSRGREVDLAAASPEAAVAETMTARGLACEAGDVTWLQSVRGGPPGRTREVRALVRARSGTGEPSDLYLLTARVSPEGTVLDVGEAYDLTNTSGVDESTPTLRGDLAAYTASADGFVTGVHVIDLRGRRTSADFTFLQRQQAAITSLQQTGQAAGIVHDAFALDPVARLVTLAWRADGLLEAHADGHAIVIDPRSETPDDGRVVSGAAFVRVVPDQLAHPGNLVTWAVDRVRAIPAFGDERMQWLKAVAFTALDKWNAAFTHGTTAKDVADELGLALPATATDAPGAKSAASDDLDTRWPPAPMQVPVSPALPGEGKWIPLDADPFITPTASGAPPAFVTSFVRPNVHRQDFRVYVTLWDPRQIALHMEAGTVEPISANGEHGTGMVPRTPEVMKRFVAAFNGGFQAQHGEYGMQANGIEYLPPKPYAATVVELRDGSNGFGAWPGPVAGTEGAPVPDDVIAFRQNLTALIQDGRYNPWGRTWWGGTPPGWPDGVPTARSAICMTSEGFVGYFYSSGISAEDLARGMLNARCSFGIHLDMNPGHAGFEFYDVAPQGELRPLGRALQGDWEAEGKVADMSPFVFRARRMIRGMGHMLFPRYIQREARDFFYLTSRNLLPGAQVPVSWQSDADEGVWRTSGLPQHGFPHAIATAWVRASADGVKLRVVRADPRAMRPAAGAAGTGEAPTVLSLVSPAKGPVSLWWSDGVFSVAPAAPTPHAVALATGTAPTPAPTGAATRAAVGVQDEDGMLAWVEVPAGTTPDEGTTRAMDALLARMGCSTRMLVGGGARALLGGSLDASGAPAVPLSRGSQAESTARLVRDRGPDAHSIFLDTPIVTPQVWQPLQAKRVRYFYKPAPPASASASAPPTSPATTADRVQSTR